MSDIQAWVFDPTGTEKLGELSHRIGTRYLDEYNGLNYGSVQFFAEDYLTALASGLLNYRNIVKLKCSWTSNEYDGAFRILGRSFDVDKSESLKRRVMTVEGLGLPAMTADGLLYPEYGVRQITGPDRYFNFASRDERWMDGEWTPPSVFRQIDMPSMGIRTRPTDGWPDPYSCWMYADPDTPPFGTVWYRSKFTLAEAMPATLHVVADDVARVYLDGDLVIELQGGSNCADRPGRYDIGLLPAGDHVIAIEGIDDQDWFIEPPDARVEVMWTLTEMMPPNWDSDDDLPVVLARSGLPSMGSSYGTSTLCRTSTNGRPGWRLDQILRISMEEAQARGALGPSALTLGFTDSLDSYGNAWMGGVYELRRPHQSTIAELIPVLVASGQLDVWTDPVSMKLHAAPLRGSDRTSTVVLEPGGSVLSMKEEGAAPHATRFLVETVEGWVEVADEAAELEQGRIEGGISAGNAASLDTARAQVEELLQLAAYETRDLSLEHTIEVGPKPFENYFSGDLVGVRLNTGRPAPARVMSIAIAQDENGAVTAVPELDLVMDAGDGSS